MANTPWWGEFSPVEQQQLCWSIGERTIVIQRLACEWNTWNLETDSETGSPLIFNDGNKADLLSPTDFDRAIVGRHLQRTTSERIHILPALADRSVVARPAIPLRVLPGEHIRLYVSTPLWFSAFTLPENALLLDVPFWRPSDSWFGPSTLKGEICYAKYTDARLHLDNTEHRHHRAITPISVINQSAEALDIERLSVPVPLLSLYSDSEGLLWTETITVTRDADNETAELDLGKQAPPEASDPILVNRPRIAAEKRTLVRSISSLFA